MSFFSMIIDQFTQKALRPIPPSMIHGTKPQCPARRLPISMAWREAEPTLEGLTPSNTHRSPQSDSTLLSRQAHYLIFSVRLDLLVLGQSNIGSSTSSMSHSRLPRRKRSFSKRRDL